MVSRKVNIITGLIAFACVATFTIGLAKSIISGFAGFKGGLPFAIIVAIVLSLAFYDFYDSAIRKPKDEGLDTKKPKDKKGRSTTTLADTPSPPEL